MQSFFNAQGEDLHEAKYSNKGNLKIPKFFLSGRKIPNSWRERLNAWGEHANSM